MKVLHVINNVRIGELPIAQQSNRLHEAARDHLSQKHLGIDPRHVRLGMHVGRTHRQVPQRREGDAHDLLPGSGGDELHERCDRKAVLGKVDAHVGKVVEPEGETLEAEGELVQLLDGRVGLPLRDGGGAAGALLLLALAELTGEVLDAPRGREDLTTLRGAHEGHHGGDGGPDGGGVRALELRDEPRRQCLQRFDGGGVRRHARGRRRRRSRRSVLATTARRHRRAPPLGRTRRQQNLRQTQRRAPLGVRIALPLADHAQKALPLLDQIALHSGVEDVPDRDAVLGGPRGAQRGQYGVQLGDGVVRHDPQRIGVEGVERPVFVALLGDAGDVSGHVERCLGEELEEDPDVHRGVAGVSQRVFDGVGFGHAQQSRFLRREAEGGEGVPLDVAEGRRYWGGGDCHLRHGGLEIVLGRQG
mmetsp:Transcript_3294/g.7283  ORF Transcript_3294/g.7283 Transcript_3294/m.7283 type:complete len:418 (+) Transcript_3294:630-1883(+)